jgi:branched-chain amino acid transport system permease protein
MCYLRSTIFEYESINGFTGCFHLDMQVFIAIGAYTTAILAMPVAVKLQNFF